MWNGHADRRCYIDCGLTDICTGVPQEIRNLVYQHTRMHIACARSFIDTYTTTIDLRGLRRSITIPSDIMKVPMGRFYNGDIRLIGNIDVIIFEEV